MKNLVKTTTCTMLAMVIMFGLVVPVMAEKPTFDPANLIAFGWNIDWRVDRENFLQEVGYVGEPIVEITNNGHGNRLRIIGGLTINGFPWDISMNMTNNMGFLISLQGTTSYTPARNAMLYELGVRRGLVQTTVTNGITGVNHFDNYYIFSIDEVQVVAAEFFSTLRYQGYVHGVITGVFAVDSIAE
ncbi:MAG: hypothetical protein FWG63_11630 [Defluviitaleaceae bacterium]|nr:hypothetical protein [Defluviitaleaceae bacterium]